MEILSWQISDRRIGLTTVGEYTISTVKLPANHGFDDMPLWYETMIFLPNSTHDIYMERYATEAEAIQGHVYAIGHAKSLLKETE